MKALYTLSFCFAISILIAQPTITSSWAPEIGDKVEDVVGAAANMLTAGESGANASWNYSDVQEDTSVPVVSFTYMDPSVSDFASLFPDANLALLPSLGDPAMAIGTFYNVSSDKFDVLGNGLPSVSIVYSNPQTFMKFPFSYGDNFQDDFSAVSDALGIISYIDGQVFVEADAYGTIQTPNGTESNVIRVRTETVRKDSVSLAPGTHTVTVLNTTQYIWLKNGLANNVASLTISSGESVTTLPGMDPVISPIAETRSFNWSKDISSGINDINSTVPLILESMSPNPVIDDLKIKLISNCYCELKIEVTNLLGQVVLAQQANLIEGINEIDIELDPISEGNYFVKLTQDNKSSSFKIQKVN